jgi:hypothetical protein
METKTTVEGGAIPPSSTYKISYGADLGLMGWIVVEVRSSRESWVNVMKTKTVTRASNDNFVMDTRQVA